MSNVDEDAAYDAAPCERQYHDHPDPKPCHACCENCLNQCDCKCGCPASWPKRNLT